VEVEVQKQERKRRKELLGFEVLWRWSGDIVGRWMVKP